ncbi:amidohydrolase family protein [Mobilicoccus caccae]|uniref:Amidohydrolase n=1 Tax=Mobilicoccus caccae TaxID=1859295 RepID=A0ABQ6IQZ4_9MICO|nr:amidohydrolase family protein [Mobilicoccus caccae]GMA40317.1 amidohydrolase [Mobilicoccus caccae]
MAVGGEGAVETVRTAPEGSRIERPSLSPEGRLAYLVFADAGGTGEVHVDGRRVSEPGEDVFIAPPRWLETDRLLYTADGVVRVRDLRSGAKRVIPFTANFEIEREAYTLKVVDPARPGPSTAVGLVTPRISPDGRTLAFIALNRIWLRRGNRNPQQLLDPGRAYTVGSLSWARDGRSLLYSSDREGLLAIYRYDLRTRRHTRLTELAGAQFDPALSPDGAQLAFQDERNSIRVLDLASGEHRVIADPVAGRERVGPPSWSPDGRFIAYNDRSTINTRFREGYNQIKVIDVASRAVRMYSPVPHGSLSDRGDCGPVWSPDGKWMAFVMESALWVLPVTPEGAPAGEPRRLTSDAADAPSWTADSRTIWHLAGRRLRRVDVPSGRTSTAPTPRIHYRRERPNGTVRVHAGRLWDGTGDAPREDVDVLVKHNRIVAVEPHRSSARADRDDARFVDASEQTVLPGLWDCHNHPTEQQAFGGRYFGLMLAYGITTNISMGSIAYEGLNHRESLASGDFVGGRHFTAGELFDGTRTSHPPTRAFATMEGLERSLRRARELRYDYIKTYVRTPMPMMERAAQVAHADLGVPSGTHLLAQGLSAGLDMITHLSATQRLEYSYSQSPAGHIYQDVAALVGKGAFRVIVTPFDSLQYVADDPRLLNDPRVRTLMPPWVSALLAELPATTPAMQQTLAAEIAAYKRLLEAGGILLAGSDAPIVPPGISWHTGLRAMVRGGIPLADVLRTATVWPATIMGVADRLGTVTAGKVADLTFVDGDPFTDVDDLVRTSRVMTNGRLVTQEQVLAPFTDEGAGPGLGRTLAGVGAAHWGAVGRDIAADACCARR